MNKGWLTSDERHRTHRSDAHDALHDVSNHTTQRSLLKTKGPDHLSSMEKRLKTFERSVKKNADSPTNSTSPAQRESIKGKTNIVHKGAFDNTDAYMRNNHTNSSTTSIPTGAQCIDLIHCNEEEETIQDTNSDHHDDIEEDDGIASLSAFDDSRSYLGPEEFKDLVPVESIAHTYRDAFAFKFFNSMQSRVFDELYRTDENVVVTAPTGSGKTALFELAIIRMLSTDHTGKAVYLAPLKALCSERVRDWSRRLTKIGCSVLEFTGDNNEATEADVIGANLVVATPEKWDVVTRRASEVDPLLSNLALFMVDEVHSVREKVRGARLEVLIARTKARQASVRIVAVSATIPNSADIAKWIGRRNLNETPDSGGDLVPFVFSEAYRPCQLHKIVFGYRDSPVNDQYHKFEKYLDTKVIDVMAKYANDKPTLIFCPSRKGTMSLAQYLAGEIERRKNTDLIVNIPVQRGAPENVVSLQVRNELLRTTSEQGVAFHHAGLDIEDKRSVEEAFLAGKIKILCATTSLSVGVNLPAYLVIIKGTKSFGPNMEWEDLSDLTVLQMMGRAGRPQFDTSGCCVIMTEESDALEWESLVSGRTTIESTLHHDLTEHVNAEIVVQGQSTAQELEGWLKGTFLFVRLQRNPAFYRLPHCQGLTDPEEVTRVTICRILNVLSEHDLVSGYGPSRQSNWLEAAPYGTIMANYCLRFTTMITLLHQDASRKPWSVESLVGALTRADEFKDFFLRQGENKLYELALSQIRFPPKAVASVADKVSVLLQAHLAGIDLAECAFELDRGRNPLSIRQETHQILQFGPKIARAALSIAIERKDGESAVAALELSRALVAKSWDFGHTVLLQVKKVAGPFARDLYNAGITSVYELADAKIPNLQRILNLRENIVFDILKEARKKPRLELKVRQGERLMSDVRAGYIECKMAIALKLQHPPNDMRSLEASNMLRPLCAGVLVFTKNKEERCCFYNRITVDQLKGGDNTIELPCRVRTPEDVVYVVAAIEEIAGSACQIEYRIRQTGREGLVMIADSAKSAGRTEQVVARAPSSPPSTIWHHDPLVLQSAPISSRLPEPSTQPAGAKPAKATGRKAKVSTGAKKDVGMAGPSCSHTCPPGCPHPCCPHRYVVSPPKRKRKKVDKEKLTREKALMEKRIAAALEDVERQKSSAKALARHASESSEDIPLAIQAQERRLQSNADSEVVQAMVREGHQSDGSGVWSSTGLTNTSSPFPDYSVPRTLAKSTTPRILSLEPGSSHRSAATEDRASSMADTAYVSKRDPQMDLFAGSSIYMDLTNSPSPSLTQELHEESLNYDEEEFQHELDFLLMSREGGP